MILVQIHCLYAGSQRQTMVHEDSSAEGDCDFYRVTDGDKPIIFRSFSDNFLLEGTKSTIRESSIYDNNSNIQNPLLGYNDTTSQISMAQSDDASSNPEFTCHFWE